MKSLRTLLLQIRDDPIVRQEEHESFVRYSGLASSQIEILNVFDNPTFSPREINGYDALFIGGGSEATVLDPVTFPFINPSAELLLHCVDREIPVFASCMGFQLAVVALGGEIIRDENDFEMGTISIHLTEASKDDPLFYDTEDGFLAVAVHQEKALEIPENCELLAYTDACQHAFRIRDKPFWAFQFHPEVDKQVLIDRLTIYQEKYTNGAAHLQKVLASAGETPESNKLVKKFIERVLGGSMNVVT